MLWVFAVIMLYRKLLVHAVMMLRICITIACFSIDRSPEAVYMDMKSHKSIILYQLHEREAQQLSLCTRYISASLGPAMRQVRARHPSI
jgi:hypothetical protein